MTSRLVVNSIRHTGSSSDAVTLASDGTAAANLSTVNSVTMPNGGFLSNRNIIINGAMQVSEYGTSSTVNGFGSLDRWQFNYGGTDNPITQSKINVAPTETGAGTAGFRNAFRITNGNQTSGFGATDYFQLQQMIEDQNIANSGWIVNDPNSNITVSYWIRSSVAQQYFGFVETYHGDDWMYGWSTGVLSANTWTKITKTVPGRSNLTWGNDNGAGLLVAPVTLWGTNYTDSSVGNDAWHQYFSSSRTPDATSTWWTTNGATVDITGVQLEVGSSATDFEHKSFAQELLLCQRYYRVLTDGSQDGTSYIGLMSYNYDVNSVTTQINFIPEMRATPSAASTTGTNYYRFYRNSGYVDINGMNNLNGMTRKGGAFNNADSGNGTAGQAGGIVTNNASAKIAFSAEL